MAHVRLMAITFIAAGSLLMAAGCDSIGSGGDPDWDDGAGEPQPGPGGPAGYGSIPRSAARAADGNGRLEYQAPREGRIWVGNENRRYEVVSHNVRKGDRVEVIPDRDRVELNDQPIFTQNMEKNDRHAVYYREAGSDNGGPGPYGGVPNQAESVAGGGGRLEWRAYGHGRVWVGNDKQKRVIVQHVVNAGDVVEVDPGSDQIKLNGRVIYSQNLESKHSHSIFFK